MSSVKTESAALRAGIGAADVIIAVDGRPVRDAREIETAIASSQTGTVRITYLIKGSWKTEREVKVR